MSTIHPNTSRRLWYAAVPVVLAVVSWFLGGNAVWAWAAGISALVVIAFALGSLRVVAQRDLQAGDFLQVGYLLLCWGSWAAVGYYLPITTIRVEPGGLNSTDEEPNCPFRVFYDGEVRAEVARGPGCSFRIRGKVQADRLKVETLAPRGWIDRPFRHYGGDIRLETILTTVIYVDNRGQEGATIRCGQVSLDVPTDGKGRFRIPALAPGEGVPLTLAGKELGTLDDRNALVDPLGTRTYRLRTLTYVGGLEMAIRLTDPGRDDPVTVVTLPPALVHKLPGTIDYFLEPAPEKLEVTTFGVPGLDKASRTELIEEP